ncbi:hypothetical protein [Algoriphagus marinus]|uniref:hypothetical protein n=1 Tax=Algoriphagus marinus TaxID=1925762 RepID=UPI00094B8FB2|nr:hypothetical protein [Algoriphagus marinus]
MIAEIEEERAKSQESRDETLVTEILGDIKENLSKINHHGKRADTIVKGMLEHSRANKGEKSLTDLNALADEFVRLSYHGIRAKDKSFNAVPIFLWIRQGLVDNFFRVFYYHGLRQKSG